MKLFLALAFFGVTANAAVDYVAIGKIINSGKAQMAATREGVTCILKKYENDQSCSNLETSNDHFKRVIEKSFSGVLLYNCHDSSYSSVEAKSPYYIAQVTLEDAKKLAKDAKPEDAIWAVIEKYERSLTSLQTELEESYEKVKFNETYVTKCMFGLEPSPVTIKSLICE